MKKYLFAFLCVWISHSVYAEDSVNILSISPASSSPVYVGQKIKIIVKAEYNLESAKTGVVALVVQKSEYGEFPSMILANESEKISKGSGTVTLSKEFVVPKTKGLVVFVPVTPEGSSETSIVQSKMYKVLLPDSD